MVRAMGLLLEAGITQRELSDLVTAADYLDQPEAIIAAQVEMRHNQNGWLFNVLAATCGACLISMPVVAATAPFGQSTLENAALASLGSGAILMAIAAAYTYRKGHRISKGALAKALFLQLYRRARPSR